MVQIAIERIGDDQNAERSLWRGVLNDSIGDGVGDAVIGRFPSRAWCARITGFDSKYGYRREFLQPNVSYQRANSIGSRGVMAYYNLDDGVYEVSDPVSWGRTDRYFLKVTDSESRRILKSEVELWLSSHLE